MQKVIDWTLTEEIINEVKDPIEIETGEFHWMTKKGTLVPVSELTIEQVNYAKKVCNKRIDRFCSFIELEGKPKKALVRQVHRWTYRLKKLMEHEDMLNGNLEIG